MVRSLLATAAASVTLAACTPEAPKPDPAKVADLAFEQTVQRAVRRSLKDPESAQFQLVHYYRADDMACGQVNARNSFGGYTGFEDFVYDKGMTVTPSTMPDRFKRAFARCHDSAARQISAERQAILDSYPSTIAEIREGSLPQAEKDKLIGQLEGQMAALKNDKSERPPLNP